MLLPSESPAVYRAEYLAYRFMGELAQPGAKPLNVEDFSELQRQIANFASPRYRESYEKGIHDHDAAHIVRPGRWRCCSGPIAFTMKTRPVTCALAVYRQAFYAAL